MDYRQYVDFFKSRCGESGFAITEDVQIGDLACDVVAHKEGFELTRFGNAVYFYFLARRPSLSVEQLTDLSAACHAYALQNRRNKLPIGFFNGVFTFPFFCCEAASEETARFAEQYRPTHWSAQEFPVVVDLSTGDAHYFQKTPLWGAAYYRRSREIAADLTTPLRSQR